MINLRLNSAEKLGSEIPVNHIGNLTTMSHH